MNKLKEINLKDPYIVVIISLIIVISIILIINLINTTKKTAFKRNIDAIITTTDKEYQTKKIRTYTLEQGKINNIEIENKQKYNGTIKYDSKGNNAYAINNGKLCMTKDINGKTEIKKYEENNCIIPDPYKDGTVIYYDVLKGETCTNYKKDNSKTGYNGINGTRKQNSCLKFYLFNYDEGDKALNLILDHNTTTNVEWDLKGDSEKGPVEVLKQLKEDTKDWIGTKTPSDYVVSQKDYVSYVIDYDSRNDSVDYRARLITANEVAEITGHKDFDENKIGDEFYFDTNNKTASEKCKEGNIEECNYSWLYDRTHKECTKYGCLNNANEEVTGYWTSTTSYNSNPKEAWSVMYNGSLYYDGITMNGFGIRPVIEVLKEKIYK